MKFEAARFRPGRVKIVDQNGTDPSPKSIQVGCASGIPHWPVGSPSDGRGETASAQAHARAMTASSFFKTTPDCVADVVGPGFAGPHDMLLLR